MRKIILGVAAIAVLAAPLAGITSAQADPSTAPGCTPQAAVAGSPAVVEVKHTEWQWAALVAKPAPLHWEYKWTTSSQNPSTDLAHIWVKSFPDGNIFKPQVTRTVIDVAAKDAVAAQSAETCTYRTVAWKMPSWNGSTPTFPQTLAAVSGSPTATPNLSDFDTTLADGCYQVEIYRNSPQSDNILVGGSRTSATNPVQDLRQSSDTKTIKVGNVDDNCVPHFTVPFTGDPNPASCKAAGSFGIPAGGVASQWRDDTFYYDGGKVTLLVDRSVAGKVNLYVFANDDKTILDGLDPAKWNVNADGRSATRTITLDPQLAVSYGVPTVTGFGANGVVDFGASACGTWKVGSKTTLTDGSEFQTHGGTPTSGPVTRYRLVFTPDAGLTLPAVPAGFTQVGNSAVYFVYLAAGYEVKFSEPSGTHINLPDVFDIEHTEYPEGTYYSTQVKVTVTNDTNTDREFRIRYADVQDGERVWVERAIFVDGMPNNVVAAHSSRPMVLDVWHNVVSGADVPDDLTLDFGFELA